uniref:Nonstructural protein 1 n=1 Tax=Phylloscopus proregulus ambidensovirus TaxID=2794568 RepID=A0A8A4XE77_9VIRU|nr:MAG: nonstructural protein 1 [Phylloscopus proregulus ambidensovirus]
MSEIGMVDSSCPEAGEVCGDPLPISGWCISNVKSKYPDDYEDLLCKLRELDNGLIRKLENNNWKPNGHFYEHVIPITRFTDVEELYKILDTVGNEEFKRQLFGYAFDGDHIHVFHDCAKSNGGCRCGWRKVNFPNSTKTKAGKREPLRFIGFNWLYIVLYFLYRKRGPQKIWINGILQGFSLSGKLLFWDNVYSDFMAGIYLQIKSYDGNKSREDTSKYWMGKKEEIMFSVNQNTTVLLDGQEINIQDQMEKTMRVLAAYMEGKELKCLTELPSGGTYGKRYNNYSQPRSNFQYRR